MNSVAYLKKKAPIPGPLSQDISSGPPAAEVSKGQNGAGKPVDSISTFSHHKQWIEPTRDLNTFIVLLLASYPAEDTAEFTSLLLLI